jgi:hypothetical protein
MNSIRKWVHIGEDRKIVLELPPEITQTEAEVIVLIPDETPSPDPLSFNKFLDWLSEVPRPTKTKEEIDQFIESERSSWE